MVRQRHSWGPGTQIPHAYFKPPSSYSCGKECDSGKWSPLHENVFQEKEISVQCRQHKCVWHLLIWGYLAKHQSSFSPKVWCCVGVTNKFNGLNNVEEMKKYWVSCQSWDGSYLYGEQKDCSQVIGFRRSCIIIGEIVLLSWQMIHPRGQDCTWNLYFQ